MPLIHVEIPPPKQLRGGWAVAAALEITPSPGWDNLVYALEDLWYYHDGGGNWACIKFLSNNQAVLFGHDHEMSKTYFRNGAADFGEPETNLLYDAPPWWEEAIQDPPDGPYIGFIYGWNGVKWQRAEYDIQDGFLQVGLLNAIKLTGLNSLCDRAELADTPVNIGRLRALVEADCNFTESMLEAVIPLDERAGVAAAKNFLLAKID